MRIKSVKSDQVRDAVFRAILHGEYGPGDRIPPERDMALRTNTSRITVRKAYGELEKAGILCRVRGRGTTIATQAQGSASKSPYIAFLTSLDHAFALSFLKTMERELSQQDGFLILKLTDEDPQSEESIAINLVAGGVRNLVVWPSGSALRRSTFERLRILGTNIVFFDRILPGDYADFVGMDNAFAMRTLVEYAKDKRKAKNFVLVGHSNLNVDSDRLREEEFFAACREFGLMHKLVRVPWRGDVERELLEHRDEWFAPKKDLAVICINDDIAIAVSDIVPKSNLVCGIDGLDAAIAKGIVTYRQPMAEMARACIEHIYNQQQLASNWTPGTYLFKGELVLPQ